MLRHPSSLSLSLLTLLIILTVYPLDMYCSHVNVADTFLRSEFNNPVQNENSSLEVNVMMLFDEDERWDGGVDWSAVVQHIPPEYCHHMKNGTINLSNYTLLQEIFNRRRESKTDRPVATLWSLRLPDIQYAVQNWQSKFYGFNAERMIVMESIFAALSTGRQLVEPFINAFIRNSTAHEEAFRDGRLGEHEDFYIGEDVIRASEVFDLRRMEKLLGKPVMSLEEFHDLTGGEIELRVDPNSAGQIPLQFVLANRFWHITNFTGIYMREGERSRTLHPDELPSVNCRLGIGPQNENYVQHAVVHVDRQWWSPTPLNWHEIPNMFYWPIRQSMKYAPHLYRQAWHVMQKYGLLEESDGLYIGLHWRRGDRGNWEMGKAGREHMERTKPEAMAAVVLAVNAHLERRCSVVFVAHNCGTASDLRKFEKTVAPMRVVYLRPRDAYPTPLLQNRNMIIEQIIVSRAYATILDEDSAVSRAIQEERVITGFSHFDRDYPLQDTLNSYYNYMKLEQ